MRTNHLLWTGSGHGRSAAGGSHLAPTRTAHPRGRTSAATGTRPIGAVPQGTNRVGPLRPGGPEAAPETVGGGHYSKGHAHRCPRARGRPGRLGGRAWRRDRADVPRRPAGVEEAPAHPQAAELREGPLAVVVHAPYVVNLA